MTRRIERLGIVGAGAWGTALACVAARAGREVVVWAREPEVAGAIEAGRGNPLFLPDVPVPPIHATTDLSRLAECDACLLVTPAQHLRVVTAELMRLAGALNTAPRDLPLVVCAKGIEKESGLLLTQVLEETAPGCPSAVLSGPSFAADVARGLPTAVTLACADAELGRALVAAIGQPEFRPYLSGDPVGAQVGGAVKNVLAIACGVVEGKQLGESARAALITRGFAEMARLGRALGAQPGTLGGLSGLGDLVLTCSSRQSRNMSLGVALGTGETLADILADRRSVAEGVHSAGAVLELARRHEVEMPISHAVAAIVAGRLSVDDAIDGLLSRPFTEEA